MKKQFTLIQVILLACLGLLGGCADDGTADDALSGRVTVWHSWSSAESDVLNAALAEFEEIHPEVDVVPVPLSAETILEEFYRAGEDGLGPALFIGRNEWLAQLADDGLLRPPSGALLTAPVFTPHNRALTTYQDEVFGVPLSLTPRALYYNADRVSTPPRTLQELLDEAAAGNRVAFVPRFTEAYWGIQAFGDGLFDSDGRLTPANSGLTRWLGWLENAQGEPGVILNVDDQSLLELFATGDLAYYVAGPEKLAEIQALQDADAPFEVGVAPLPAGPDGDAGPLLSAETIYLYAYVSAEQARIADDLAAFLANDQQSIRFMRDLQRVPSNPRVRVDRRLYPIVSGFSRQAESAVVVPNGLPTDAFIAAGDRMYASVLSGVLTAEEAVCRFGVEADTLPNMQAVEVQLPDWCATLIDTPSQ